VTLLDDIIEDASGTVAVTTLLRKLRIVASRTDTAKLGEWVTRELEGYLGRDDLPPYRGPIPIPVVGDFYGAFNTSAQGVGIPPSTFPEELRDGPLFTLRFSNPLAEIEEMATRESLHDAWPSDAVRYYNHAVLRGTVTRIVREDMALGQARKPVPRQIFVGVIDAVRNRVLELALEIEKVAPGAGQQAVTANEKADVGSVVNNIFTFQAAANVAVGSTNVTQTVGLPACGDQAALLRYLGAIGVEPQRVVDLQAALEADRIANHKSQGPKVTAWLGDVTTAVTTGVATSAILAALKAYFGV
jgi:hypothetical protein